MGDAYTANTLCSHSSYLLKIQFNKYVNNVNNKLRFSVSLNLNNWIMDVNDLQDYRLHSFWNFMKRSLNKKTIFYSWN